MPRFRTVLAAALTLLVAVPLAACGSSDDGDATGASKSETTAARSESLEIGVLLTGPKGGGVFDVAGGNALDAIAKREGAKITYAESVDLAKQLQAFEDLAEGGADIVFGHSDAFRDGAIAAARKHPDTWFVATGTGSEPDADLPPNFIAVEIAENEVGYLSGYTAGLLTETDKVGWVGSMPLVLRSTKDLNTLIDLGLRVVTVDGEIDLSTADGEFRATMLAALARFEARRKAERQIRSNERRRAEGTSAACSPRTTS